MAALFCLRTWLRAGVLLLGILAVAHSASAQKGWEEFRCEKGHYRILFPGKPLRDALPTPFADYDSLIIYKYRLIEPGVFFMVVHGEFKPRVLDNKSKDQIIDETRDNGIRQVKGQLLREDRIFYNGHAGREVLVKSHDGAYVKARYFVIKRTLYQLVAVTDSEEYTLIPEVNNFFQSFARKD